MPRKSFCQLEILRSVECNVPFLSFVLSLSSHIVGFIKELS